MDDDYGADEDLLAAMAAADPTPSRSSGITQPTPQRIAVQQPRPQRLDKAPPSAASSGSKIVQPTPQALPQKAGSTILVSPRQRGNPVLTCLRSMPWEYSDIPADYVMGLTTCALFLSLKYHRLHPEYIYTRIQNLQGKYQLRILLTMVDIPNHEDPLRELSKTSLVNNATLILCWSAAEAARYLELYKSYEGHSSFAAIKGQQSSSYADRLVDFVTVPRSLNKSDAVALVANFGSLRNAVNADPDALGLMSGWGGVKVKRWTKAVEEPFRAKKAAKRGGTQAKTGGGVGVTQSSLPSSKASQAVPSSKAPGRDTTSSHVASSGGRPAQSASSGARSQFQLMGDLDDDDDEEAMLALAIEESKKMSQPQSTAQSSRTNQQQDESSQKRSQPDELDEGIAAALAKLRENAG